MWLACGATSNVAFNFTITAYDAFNNIATDYTGTVHFTSTDSDLGTVLPANYSFLAGDLGTRLTSATLQTVGNQTISATDTVTSSITGTSNTITVAPNSLLGQVAASDADFKHIDGFDVLFGKGSTNSVNKLKNTIPERSITC